MKIQDKILILVVVGCMLVGVGIFKIVSAGTEVESLDINQYDISPNPRILTIPDNVSGSDFGSSTKIGSSTIQYLSMYFSTNDTFSVGNPVHFSIKLKLKAPDINNVIKKVVFMAVPAHDNFSYLGKANIQEFLDRYNKNLIPLQKNSSDTYGIESDGEFYTPQDISYLFLIIGDQNTFEKYVDPYTLFTVTSYSDTLQEKVNRLSIQQAILSNKVAKEQASNGDKVEGLTWILIGWLPIQWARDMRRDRKEEQI